MRDPTELSNRESSAIDNLFLCLARGDVAGARACFTPTAVVWHNFDCLPLTLDGAVKGWTAFIGAFPERGFKDIRRTAISNGFLQQHLTVARDAKGDYRAWPTCVVVTMQDQKINRLDEYLDRAGSLMENLSLTPGFPPLKGP
jgi:ketosteroid isomerase-like protein